MWLCCPPCSHTQVPRAGGFCLHVYFWASIPIPSPRPHPPKNLFYTIQGWDQCSGSQTLLVEPLLQKLLWSKECGWDETGGPTPTEVSSPDPPGSQGSTPKNPGLNELLPWAAGLRKEGLGWQHLPSQLPERPPLRSGQLVLTTLV